jgi:catechol 2,3-dioxygenase-like lactoylglutathione lyase family enzyme
MNPVFTLAAFFFVVHAHAQVYMEPYRFGIVVSNVEAAEQWYGGVLEFSTYKKMDFPQYDSLRIRFMKRGNFEIELVGKRSSFSIRSLKPDYDMNAGPLQGFMKIAFRVADVQRTFDHVKQRGAKVIMGVAYDQTFDVDFFIIEDPDGNMLQFIGPAKKG